MVQTSTSPSPCSKRLSQEPPFFYRPIVVMILFLALPSFPRGHAFRLPPSPLSTKHTSSLTSSPIPLHLAKKQSTQLCSNNNGFDITKPTFDLLSFRNIRSDALLRYNTLNQSEPLRINLFLLSTVTLLGYPLWSESVTGDVATTPSIAAAIAAGVGSASLFWRERTRRSNQLRRMEKELNAERLKLRLPVNEAFSSVRPTATLKELRGKRRILAIRGTKASLREVFQSMGALRNRFVQSQTLVVLVPTDGSCKEDWDWNEKQNSEALWLANPINIDGNGGWLEYFNELLESNDSDDEIISSKDELAWFALNFKGRSIASGLGEPPRAIELLGQQLQPMEILDESDESKHTIDKHSIVEEILDCQSKFYSALTGSSDENEMITQFSKTSAREVDEVLSGGGRIDSWNECLKPGARPAGMKTAGSDVWIVSENLAYSTCVEFPENTGFDSATLLALQRWSRDNNLVKWKLELHQTIPWSVGSRAGGTLRCDCRGCVALTRAQERRTFGGLIG
mmetsp:Transcript_31101/g.62609  ORF Transcript_31101/g.62609 Transcript_31101/m.62609 type:complete len:511 (+) Transcript_31101:96-1628(+)